MSLSFIFKKKDCASSRKKGSFYIICRLPFNTLILFDCSKGPGNARKGEDLDGLFDTDAGQPGDFSSSMMKLHERFGIKIMGGCCGTDSRHIEEIAKRIKKL